MHLDIKICTSDRVAHFSILHFVIMDKKLIKNLFLNMNSCQKRKAEWGSTKALNGKNLDEEWRGKEKVRWGGVRVEGKCYTSGNTRGFIPWLMITGYYDTGITNPQAITPTINRLASEGVYFNQSYVHAICTP